MKKRFLFVTGLLAVSAALIFVSAPEVKACEGGGGDKQHEVKECYEYNPATGEVIHTGSGNNCPDGGKECTINRCG